MIPDSPPRPAGAVPLAALLRRAAAVVALLGLAGCAVAPAGVDLHDPYEPSNRRVHAFNKGFDRVLLRPAGQVAAAAPMELRRPVENFAGNVALPGMVLNGLLQGDIGGAATNAMRFIVNSTVGVLGLADPAGLIGLPMQDTDFGETLAVWGLPEGAFLELPLFGPSTQRDAAGLLVDMLLDPLGEVGTRAQRDYALGARTAEIVIYRGTFGTTFDDLFYNSADSYAQSRLIYLQNRRFELGQADEAGYVDPYADAFAVPYAAAPAAPTEEPK